MERSDQRLREPQDRGYFLFCGHRGCGKSTELRRIRDDLDAPDTYYVVFADAAQELDVNNLRYQDILLHLAGKLVERLEGDGLEIERVHLRKLEDWFSDRIEKQERTAEFASQVRAGARLDAGLPLIGKLFAGISNAFKTNSTYKEELRRTLQNYFSDFANAFNHLIETATEAARAVGKGVRILFVVDGTDLLRGEDARAFFESDVHQLRQVRGLFLYCAPIHLIYEGAGIGQNFDHAFKLPMIKVADPDGSPNETGCAAMREILHRRADPFPVRSWGNRPADRCKRRAPAGSSAVAAERVPARRARPLRRGGSSGGDPRCGDRSSAVPRSRGLCAPRADRLESGDASTFRPRPAPCSTTSRSSSTTTSTAEAIR